MDMTVILVNDGTGVKYYLNLNKEKNNSCAPKFQVEAKN